MGGYTPIPWSTENSKTSDDIKTYNSSWVFKFGKDKQIHKFKNIEGEEEVTHDNVRLICFTGAIDIKDDCNTNKYSKTMLGDWYELPEGFEDQDDDEARYFLNDGKQFFQVEEIEVFQIQGMSNPDYKLM